MQALLVGLSAIALHLIFDALQALQHAHTHGVGILAHVVLDAARCVLRLPKDQVLGLEARLVVLGAQVGRLPVQLVRDLEHLHMQLVARFRGVGARLGAL